MSYTNKTFEELNLIDDYLMNAVTSDPEVGMPFCRTLLSVLLQKNIGNIRVATQRIVLPVAPDKRGIRLDVEVEEEGFSTMNIYDMEPHRIPERETEVRWRKKDKLTRRNRFYQARIDSRHMNSGERDFGKLPNLYVINVLDYDPFGYDEMLYTIQNQCKEVKELDYDDGLQFLYFNITGTQGGCEEVRNLLQFIQHSNAANAIDDSTKELYDYVSRVKVQPEVRDSFMRLDEIIAIEREDAAAEAVEKVLKKAEEDTKKAVGKSVLTTTQNNIVELLEELGSVPENLKVQIKSQNELAILKKWLKLSAQAEDVEAFMKAM